MRHHRALLKHLSILNADIISEICDRCFRRIDNYQGASSLTIALRSPWARPNSGQDQQMALKPANSQPAFRQSLHEPGCLRRVPTAWYSGVNRRSQHACRRGDGSASRSDSSSIRLVRFPQFVEPGERFVDIAAVVYQTPFLSAQISSGADAMPASRPGADDRHV